jgi:hypothetical protein
MLQGFAVSKKITKFGDINFKTNKHGKNTKNF